MNFLAAYGTDDNEPSLTTLPAVEELSRTASGAASSAAVALAPPVVAAQVRARAPALACRR